MGLFDKLIRKKEPAQEGSRNVTASTAPVGTIPVGADGAETAALPSDGDTAAESSAAKTANPFHPRNYARYRLEVQAWFDRLFPGRETLTFEDPSSDRVYADIHVMKPTETDAYYVLYTTGMSEYAMALPAWAKDRADLSRAEIYLFLPAAKFPEDSSWQVSLLRSLARFPHEFHTWVGCGHTALNGAGGEPYSAETSLNGAILSQLGGALEGFEASDGSFINLLYLIPAYREEIEYRETQGMEALNARFDERRLPLVTDLKRPNFCGRS